MWVQQTMESEQKPSLGNGYQEEDRKEEVQEENSAIMAEILIGTHPTVM